MLCAIAHNLRGEKMPDRDGKGPRARSPRPKGKKKGMKLGDC